jgi:O-antigen/teichoic acid export membrane protein
MARRIAGELAGLRNSTLVRGSALLLGATLSWHASNFAFNAVSARALGTARYGALAAVVAISYVASPLFFSIQTVTSRITTKLVSSGEEDRLRGLLRYYGLRLGLGGLVLAAAVAIASSLLASFLHIPSGTPIAILGLAFLFAAITHVQRGVLQGCMRFGRFALSTLTEAIVKITAAVVLVVWISRSVEAAIAAIALASLFGLGVNSLLLRCLPNSRERSDPIPHPYRYSALTLSCLVLLALLLSIDLLAAKRYLDPHTAGLYAAISLTGKAVFFATSALAVYLFPVFSQRQEEGIDARGTLAGAIAALCTGSAAMITIYFVAPRVVILPLFGSRYEDAAPYIGWMGLAFSAYAIVYLTATYLLSQERTQVTSVLGFALLAQVCGLYMLHSSITQIIAVQATVFGATAVVLTALCALHAVVPAQAAEPT